MWPFCPVSNFIDGHPQPLSLPTFPRKPFGFTAEHITLSTWSQQHRQHLSDITLPCLLIRCYCLCGLTSPYFLTFRASNKHPAARPHVKLGHSHTLFLENNWRVELSITICFTYNKYLSVSSIYCLKKNNNSSLFGFISMHLRTFDCLGSHIWLHINGSVVLASSINCQHVFSFFTLFAHLLNNLIHWEQ